MTLPAGIAIAVHLICAILLFSSAVVVWVAWKGCRVLRRLALATTRDDAPILLKSPGVPAVSAIALMRDDSAKSLAFGHRLAELLFPRHELVLVLDGLDEDAVEAWKREFNLASSERRSGRELPAPAVTGVYESTSFASVLAIEVAADGDAGAWNAGVNAASSPVVAFFDPDTEVVPESLLRLIRPMLEEPDLVFAVCGSAPSPAEGGGLACDIGDLEATRLWLGRCAAFAGWKNMLAPVEGSAVLVRRDAIVLAGGFAAGPLELILNLQGRASHSEKPYRTAFVPEALGRLPVPRTWSELRERLETGQRALAGALRHRDSIMDGWFALGWGLPAVVFDHFGRPLLETAVLLVAIAGLPLGLVSPSLALLVLLATVGVGIPVSMSMVVFRELADFHGSDAARLTRLLRAAIAENFGYRQLRNLWLIGGFIRR